MAEKIIQFGSELTADGYRLLTETVVDTYPNTINRKNGNGVMTAYIELPPGFDAGMIDISSISLNGVPANTKPATIGDYDHDGIPDLMVKFDRGAMIPTLPVDASIATMTLTGDLLYNDKVLPFGGTDEVRIVH